MKGLLLKDFYSLKTEYKSYALMLPFIVLFMFLLNKNSIVDYSPGNFGYLATYLMVAALSLTLNSFSYDEKCGFLQYALATPVSRKGYIEAKYVFHILHGIIGAVIGTVWMIATTGIFNHTITVDNVLSAVFFSGGCLGSVIMLGVWQIGLSIRYDAAKARILFVSLVVGFGALGTLGYLTNIFGKVSILVAVLVTLALLFTVWMFCMSFVWAERKEF